MHITKQEVAAFKTSYCDENLLIAQALADSFADFMIDPIYDIGSGMGDITAASFSMREVVHVDILNYLPTLPVRHRHLVDDFFTFRPPTGIGSLLLCHVIQFLDDDVAALGTRICQLAPERVVVVQNDNSGFMGEILAWMQQRYPLCNPEIPIGEFQNLQRYQIAIETSVSATVACPDYQTLATQIHYLVDFPVSTDSLRDLAQWLESRLPSPSFAIEQTIKGYQCLRT
jgi:hypothetical protein